MKLVLTDHAIERARQRLGWNRSTLRRMMHKVTSRGLGTKHTRGSLRRYLVEHRGDGVAIRTYGEHLFIFRWDPAAEALCLVTVWQIPLPLRPALRRATLRALAA